MRSFLSLLVFVVAMGKAAANATSLTPANRRSLHHCILLNLPRCVRITDLNLLSKYCCGRQHRQLRLYLLLFPFHLTSSLYVTNVDRTSIELSCQFIPNQFPWKSRENKSSVSSSSQK
jgi:hypothetical protein